MTPAGTRPMRSPRLRAVAAATVLLVVPACSGNGTGATTTTTSPPTTAPLTTTTTTAAPTTTTTATPSTTTLSPTTTTGATALVGDPELLREMIDEQAQLWFGTDAEDAGVPIPDLTNPDPVVAVGDIFRLDEWILRSPDAWGSQWADIYTDPMTPARTAVANLHGRFNNLNEVVVDRGEPWQFHGGRIVSLDDTGLSDSQIAALPAGAVGVSFHTSVGPYDIVDATTNEIKANRPGWDEDRDWLVVVGPSEHGWVLHHVLFDIS